MKRGFKLEDQYKKSWSYLKESKDFIYSVIIIFVVFSIVGFFIPIPDVLVEKIFEYLKGILEQVQGMSQFELTEFIFWNNFKASIFGMFLGILFGIFPVVLAVSNGFLLGFVASLSVSVEGIFSLWRLLPHGIIELTAVFISLGLGLRLGVSLLKRDKNRSLKSYFVDSIRVFIFVVIPLLLIAAIIEAFFISISQ